MIVYVSWAGVALAYLVYLLVVCAIARQGLISPWLDAATLVFCIIAAVLGSLIATCSR